MISSKHVTAEQLPLEYQKLLRKQIQAMINAAQISGLAAHKVMVDFIKRKTGKTRQRKPGKKSIVDYIKTYSLINKSKYTFGIGRISLLNSKAKYWARLENGFLPGPVRGYFKDKGGRKKYLAGEGTGQIFYPNKKFPIMTPTKVVPPLRYIYFTYRWLKIKHKIELENQVSKIKV